MVLANKRECALFLSVGMRSFSKGEFMKTENRSLEQGFTLGELMIVVVIVAIFAAIRDPKLSNIY